MSQHWRAGLREASPLSSNRTADVAHFRGQFDDVAYAAVKACGYRN